MNLQNNFYDLDLIINDCSVSIITPTAITPNQDQINDTWEIVDLDLFYPENVVRIYNRWGNLIFEHLSSVTNPYGSNQWDGTYNGEELPIGSYYYIIEYNDGSSDSETGSVSIILNK